MRRVACLAVIGFAAAGCGSGGSAGAPCGPDVPKGSDALVTELAGGEAAEPGNCEGGPGIKWVSIPGGVFRMGSTSGDVGEQPVHEVTVPAFRMSRTEVRACDYGACVDAGSCTATFGPQQVDDLPVVYVDWTQAGAYCKWAGGRLCSEAEWEYAARNGSADATYPWGETEPTCDDGVFSGDGCLPSTPSASCSKPAGNDKWGVCDLGGNVWEWVEDCFYGSYEGAPTDGSAWVDGPHTPFRVARGGGFEDDAGSLRGAFRSGFYPSQGYYIGLGVRCCGTP